MNAISNPIASTCAQTDFRISPRYQCDNQNMSPDATNVPGGKIMSGEKHTHTPTCSHYLVKMRDHT